jgi:hypothetical protein
MIRVGHVTHTGETRNAKTIWLESHKETDYLGDLDEDENIKLDL